MLRSLCVVALAGLAGVTCAADPSQAQSQLLGVVYAQPLAAAFSTSSGGVARPVDVVQRVAVSLSHFHLQILLASLKEVRRVLDSGMEWRSPGLTHLGGWRFAGESDLGPAVSRFEAETPHWMRDPELATLREKLLSQLRNLPHVAEGGRILKTDTGRRNADQRLRERAEPIRKELELLIEQITPQVSLALEREDRAREARQAAEEAERAEKRRKSHQGVAAWRQGDPARAGHGHGTAGQENRSAPSIKDSGINPVPRAINLLDPTIIARPQDWTKPREMLNFYNPASPLHSLNPLNR